MMNFKTNSLLGITIFLILISISNPVFGQNVEEKIFPDWIRQSTSVWVNGEISDAEFLALIQNTLDKNIIPDEIEFKEILKYAAKTVVNETPELYGKKTSELIPHWVKDRAQWWIEGKINDIQFLRTIHYLQKVGYLENNPEKNIFSNDETFQSSLEKFLLNDKDIFDIIRETKWRTFSTEYKFEEKEGVVDSVKVVFNDITRVYEPIFYKFKVPTLVMQISEFNNQNDLDDYWNSFEDRDKQEIFDSSYLIGTPNENSECLFHYTSKGAMTSCMYDNLLAQVIIFDQYGEYYNYDADDLILDETEPTSRFSSEILKKISFYKNDNINSQLYHVLQKNIPYENAHLSSDKVQITPKSIELEKSVIQGVENFSCMYDDFGLVTISGQYHNDHIKRAQVDLTIVFLDDEENIMGKTDTSFYDLKEFESKKFVGHSKWNENFYSCQIEIK